MLWILFNVNWEGREPEEGSWKLLLDILGKV